MHLRTVVSLVHPLVAVVEAGKTEPEVWFLAGCGSIRVSGESTYWAPPPPPPQPHSHTHTHTHTHTHSAPYLISSDTMPIPQWVERTALLVDGAAVQLPDSALVCSPPNRRAASGRTPYRCCTFPGHFPSGFRQACVWWRPSGCLSVVLRLIEKQVTWNYEPRHTIYWTEPDVTEKPMSAARIAAVCSHCFLWRSRTGTAKQSQSMQGSNFFFLFKWKIIPCCHKRLPNKVL